MQRRVESNVTRLRVLSKIEVSLWEMNQLPMTAEHWRDVQGRYQRLRAELASQAGEPLGALDRIDAAIEHIARIQAQEGGSDRDRMLGTALNAGMAASQGAEAEVRRDQTAISRALKARWYQLEGLIGIFGVLALVSAGLWSARQRALALVRATLEATADGILAVDWTGRVIDWNRRFLEMWGIPPDLIASRNDEQLLDFASGQLVDPVEFRRRVSHANADATAYIADELEFKDGRTFERRSLPPSPGQGIGGRVWTFRDVTADRRAVRALRASEERWQLALRGSNAGMWDWDARTGQVFLSPRWKEILGYEDNEVANRSEEWESRMHPDDVLRVKREVAEHLAGQSPFYTSEYRMRAKDGSYRWIMARGQAQWDEAGNALRLVGSHTDITEPKLAAESLYRAKEAAEAASRSKGEFLANMSHEIRTPMTGVLGMIDLTLSSELNATQRKYLETARSSADSLLALLNDILDLSKIEAGRLDLLPEVYSLSECVGDALQVFAVPAKRKGLRLTCEISPELPDALVGDPLRVRQVLINVLGNAVKFTDAGAVSVAVKKMVEPGRPDKIQFEVEDTGIGIAPDKQLLVFDPFQQADGSSTRRHFGTGLGLTISARLAKLMGGRIGLRSELGRGSTFTFAVPLMAANAGSRPVARRRTAGGLHTAHEPLVRPLRILLAEDNEVNQKLISVLLRRDGHHVTTVSDGLEAVEALRQGGEFDVILMDVQMPVMDGFAATAAIREVEKQGGRHTSIVALTAHAMKGDEEKCLAAGMDAYLSKPILLPVLRGTLGAVAGRGDSGWFARECRRYGRR